MFLQCSHGLDSNLVGFRDIAYKWIFGDGCLICTFLHIKLQQFRDLKSNKRGKYPGAGGGGGVRGGLWVTLDPWRFFAQLSTGVASLCKYKQPTVTQHFDVRGPEKQTNKQTNIPTSSRSWEILFVDQPLLYVEYLAKL